MQMRSALVGTILALLLCAAPDLSMAQSAAATTPSAPQHWVVGTQLAPPFVVRGEDGRYDGIAITLWQEIARTLGIETEFRSFDYDSAGMYQALERGELDIAVGNLPVDDHGERRMDFTHPFLSTELGIVAQSTGRSDWLSLLGSLQFGRMFLAVAGLITLLSLVGALVWWLERRNNSVEFAPEPRRGMLDGLWWAAVTMTTTGYGDKTPRSLAGRAVAIVWMFSSIALTAALSATLASALVVDRLTSRVNGPQDLPEVRVAAVADHPATRWLERERIATHSYAFVIQALNAVRRGEAEALVHERIVLAHMLKELPRHKLVLLPEGIGAFDYAFALPPGSANREIVNRVLLATLAKPQWAERLRNTAGKTSRASETLGNEKP